MLVWARRIVLTLALAACGGGCAARQPTTSGPTARVTDLLGGTDAVAVLTDRSAAVRREAFRIDGTGPRSATRVVAGPTVQGYPVLAGPVAVDDASATALASVLVDDASYLWDSGKLCAFSPGLAVRETRGATTVEILVCFSCDQVALWVDGKSVGPEDTDPRRDVLVRIAKSLFPADPAFKALQ